MFGYDKNEIYPLRVSKLNESVMHVNMLLFSNKDGDKHYCLIRNMSRLFTKQISKHDGKKFICNFCLHGFKQEKTYNEHLHYCSKYDCVRTIYPAEGEILKFKNYERMHDVPFIVYADFECELKPMYKNIGDHTIQFQKHKPSGFYYLIVCFDDNLLEPKLVRYTKKSDDEDISAKFVKSLGKNIRKIYEKFKFTKKIIFGEKEKKRV